MRKRIICFALLLVLLLPCVFANADNKGRSGLFSYSIRGNGTAEITGFNWDGNNGSVYIPSMIDGYTVTSIGEKAFSSSKTYKAGVDVTLPNTITSIGDFAFMQAPITIINIPSSITYIGKGAFASCYLLESFNVVPDQTTYTVMDGVLYNKVTKELVSYPYKMMGGRISIPQGIKSIGDYACYGGYSIEPYYDGSGYNHKAKIKYLTIPDTVKSIGEYAFYGWKINDINDMKSYNFDYVGEMAFAEVEFSCGVNFGNIKDIGKNAFQNCEADYSLVISSTTISDYAFQCTRYATYSCIHLSAPITFVGQNAFVNENICMPLDLSKCTFIGGSAFKDAGFEAVNIYYRGNSQEDNKVTINCNISAESFAGLKASGIDFSVNCKEIADNAFNGSSLKSITLSNKLTSIGDNAFTGCKISNNEITLPSSITKIGKDAFDKGLTIHVDAGSYAEAWCRDNGMSYQYAGGNDTSWLDD